MRLVRSRSRHHHSFRVHGCQQTQLLALLGLPFQRRTIARQVRILPFQRSRRGLPARIRIRPGVQHQHLDRRVRRQNPRHRPKANIVRRPVAPDRHDVRQQLHLLGTPLRPVRLAGLDLSRTPPRQQFARLSPRQHFPGAVRRQPLKNPLRQGLRVLEQPVDPRVLVGVIRRRRSVNRRTPRRVRHHSPRRDAPVFGATPAFLCRVEGFGYGFRQGESFRVEVRVAAQFLKLGYEVL